VFKAFLAKPESPGFPKLSDCDSPCLGGWIMSAPLPSALRARFQRYIEEGLSGRAAALRLKLSPATGARWRYQIQRTGRATPAVQGRPKGSGKLAPHVGFFEELIAQDPDITLFELRDALAEATGLQVQHSAIGHLLKRLGFTHKKSRWSPPNAVAPM
jgi:transposase